MMNDYKHRDGRRHWRDIISHNKDVRFPQFRHIALEEAYDAVEHIKRFLFALDYAIEQSGVA